MNIIVTLAVGALAGWIADKIMDTPKSGLLFYILFGVGGAVVGSVIGRLIGIHTSFLSLSIGSVASAVVGACLIEIIARKLRK